MERLLSDVFFWCAENKDMLLGSVYVVFIASGLLAIVIYVMLRYAARQGKNVLSSLGGADIPSVDPCSAFAYFNATKRKTAASNSFDFNMETVSCCILLIIIIFTIAIVGTYINLTFSSQNDSYISYSSFVNDEPSLTLSALFGALALVSIFTAFNRMYGAAVGAQELLDALQFGKRVMISTVMYMAGTALNYASKLFDGFIANTERVNLYRTCFSLSSFFFFLVSGSISIFLSIKLVFLLLYEDEKLLDQLHYGVYYEIRRPSENLNLSNKASINACLEYLWKKLNEADKQCGSGKFEKHTIKLISFLDQFDVEEESFWKSVKKRASLILTLITGPLSFCICAVVMYHPIIAIVSIFLSWVLNYVLICVAIKYSSFFRRFSIQIAVGIWGFTWEQKDAGITLFNMSKRHFSRNDYWSVHDQKYLSCMYDIVAFFRNAVCVDCDVAVYVLAQIRRMVGKYRCGYLVYGVCQHFLNEIYPHRECTKKSLQDFQKTIMKNKFDKVIFSNNVSEIVRDVLRTAQKPICDYLLICKARKSI